MKIRLAAAVLAAKGIGLLCRLRGSRGSSLPGQYARKICPTVIGELAKQVRGKVLVTCGTNGKTTTNNLINDCLKQAGYTTVCNTAGANMLNGIAAAFAAAASPFGRLKADYACLEIDEANLRLAFAQFQPDYIVVTNLFRDQLDRYGEIDITAALLREAFAMAPDAQLILNADDPVTAVFGIGRDALYYGVAENPAILRCTEIRDGNNCRLCGSALDYGYYCYGQIGSYRCPSCGYTNPQAAVFATDIRIHNGVLQFSIQNRLPIQTERPGIYNVYNMLMAYAALSQLGVDDRICQAVFLAQKPQPGRMSKFTIGGAQVYLVLSKNPTGFNQSVMTVINDSRDKDILITLNDNAQDGEDISWIWDVDFEAMQGCGAGAYTVSGTRCYDMYLRLKYAGFDESKLHAEPSMPAAIAAMLSSGKPLYYVLVNYTAMYPAYLELTRLEQAQQKRQGVRAHG